MKESRTLNANRNIVFGVLQKIYQLLFPFVLRTVMIYYLGIEYVGLNSLFNSIIQVLNITELGVGVAMVYSMYKPIAKDDTDSICKLLKLYKTYYRVIGLIIAILGIVITPFIPALVKGDLPDGMNIFYLYWINLACTVLSYWLFAYKSSLLQAHQRSDVISKVMMLVNTGVYALQIIAIISFKNYYFYLMIMLLGQAITNIVTAIVSTRMYPHYKPEGKLDRATVKDINSRVKDLFTAKLGGVIQNSVDSVVISAFLGITILARYQNYYYILNAVFGFVAIIFASSLAGVGNSIITESPQKNYEDFKKITFIIEWIAGFCSCCLLCLYQPFMKLWVGEENTISFGIVICLAIYFFTIVTNQLLCLYKDGSGVWHKDRFRPLIVAFANLAMNLMSVTFLGLYGVVLSTVLSMVFIGIPWLTHNLFSSVFKRSSKEYIKQMAYYIFITFIAVTITFIITNSLPDGSLIMFFGKMGICLILPNVIYLLAYQRLQQFADIIKLVNNILKGKLTKVKFFDRYL